MDIRSLEAACLEQGAFKARVIDTDSIPFDKGLRAYCEANMCGSYDKNWACPPGVGEPDELIARAGGYSHALVFQTVGELEDSFDLEGMEAAAARHAAVAEAVRGRVTGEMSSYLFLTAGGCTVCKTCARAEDKPCRFPEKAISSLEAYCINVAALAGRCGMKYINGKDTVTYFGAILFQD